MFDAISKHMAEILQLTENKGREMQLTQLLFSIAFLLFLSKELNLQPKVSQTKSTKKISYRLLQFF